MILRVRHAHVVVSLQEHTTWLSFQEAHSNLLDACGVALNGMNWHDRYSVVIQGFGSNLFCGDILQRVFVHFVREDLSDENNLIVRHFAEISRVADIRMFQYLIAREDSDLHVGVVFDQHFAYCCAYLSSGPDVVEGVHIRHVSNDVVDGSNSKCVPCPHSNVLVL